MEIWKQFRDSNYYVSNFGNIKNFNGKCLKTFNSYGYRRIKLVLNNKRECFSIHRLVGEIFIDNVDGKPLIDHINRKRSDNRVENLRWVTHLENMENVDRSISKKTLKKEVIQKIIELYNKGYSVDKILNELN